MPFTPTRSFITIICLFLFQNVTLGIDISYPVSEITYRYGTPSKNLPDLNRLREAYISFEKEENKEFNLGALMQGTPGIFTLSDLDIFRLTEIPVHFLKNEGLEGVVAFPDPQMIDPVSGRDLRREGHYSLTIIIWFSILDRVTFEHEGLFKREGIRSQDAIKDYLFKNKAIGKPVRKEFFDEVAKIGKHSSRTSKLILTASDAPGHVNAVVRTKRNKKPHFSLSTSNTGTPTTGEWIFSMAAQTDQLTGIDDQGAFGVSISDSAESYGVFGSYYIPLVAPDILKIGTTVGYSSYDSSTYGFTKMDFNGENLFVDTSLLWNPSSLQNENWNIGIRAGLKWENVRAFNSIINYDASVPMLTPEIELSLSSRGDYRIGRTALSLSGNTLSIDEKSKEALGGINATDRYVRFAIKHEESFLFGKWVGDLMDGNAGEYLKRHIINLKLEADFALTDERHLPQHQYITGGTGSVRGYPESPVAGDHGQLISLEYRFPFMIIDSGKSQKLVWTFGTFIDWAHAQVNSPLFYESNQNLLGLGFSLNLPLPEGLYINADFAKPLREVVSDGIPLNGTLSSDYRIHANLGWNF